MKYLFALIFLFVYIPVPDNVTNRFTPPSGFSRHKNEPGSFGEWLQEVPLKPAGTRTKTFNGEVALTDAYTAAVADVSVGSQDLQQCADAVMRLRAEYLYQKKDYNKISFNFVSGFKCDYNHYANGYRYKNSKWMLTGRKDYSYTTFLRYLNLVFSYASTLSLEKELQPVKNLSDIEAGDVFIKGGSPGHCFIVMDVVENSAHQKQFLLAQSFMPAQNIQILQSDGSPWFSMGRQPAIYYGQLVKSQFLKRFIE